MTFRIKIFLSFFVLFATTAIAASIDNTASSILSGGYAFRADSLSLNSLEQSLRIESNLPDPRIDGEFLAASEGESDRWGAELSWELDWPGLYGAKRSDADKRIAAAKENIRTKQMARLRDVKGLLLDYIFYTKKIEILEQLNLSNDSIYQFAKIAAKAGEITVLDLNKAKLEKANVRAALDASINDRFETVAEIISIAGYDCTDLLASLDCEFPPLSIPSDDDLERIANLSPEIREAVSETIIAESGKKVARMEALPSISFGYKHAFEDGIHFNGGTLGFSLPVFSSRNKQKSADAAIMEAKLKEEMAGKATIANLEMVRKRLVIMKNQIEEIEPVVNESNNSELLLRAYQKGLITMIDYLTERNYFTAASIEFLSLRHSASKTLLSLTGYEM